MKIRKATIDDLRRIQELNNDLFELEIANFDKYLIKGWPLSGEGEEYFRRAIINDYVIVAECEKGIVGYLLGQECEIPYYNFRIAELCNMCVDQTFRKQGVGKSLYSEFEKYFRDNGIEHFMVTASFKNESAKAFYNKMGFCEANTTLIKF